MAIHLIKKCPHCGQDDIHRIPREWYMRLAPFTKRYLCRDCYSNFVVNFWATIILNSIVFPLRLFIFLFWRLPGLSLLWEKIHPPVSSSEEENWRVLNQFQYNEKFRF